MTKGGLANHLSKCSQRQEAIDAAERTTSVREPLCHLQVQDAWGGVYWLHLEMPGSATLEDLDAYLRAIWLECCGHMSQFSVKPWGKAIPMQTRVDQAFEPGVQVTHIYDFGTSSETLIRGVKVRKGAALTRHPVVLMARNDPPDVQCMECEQPATWLCVECVYEENEPGTLCDEHVEVHPHEDYGEPLPVVNSPRVGMCGYGGPAEPPY
jgi:hypothetical protein